MEVLTRKYYADIVHPSAYLVQSEFGKERESRPDQAYYLTESGLQLLSELLKK